MTETFDGGRSIAGAPGDFVMVRHLVLTGSQSAIGFQLARAAANTYGSAPHPIPPVLGRARHRWFEQNWPEHYDRCRGMAAALGVADDDVSLCVDNLGGLPLASGCSAVWHIPSTSGQPIIVRNFDIHTSVIDTAPEPDVEGPLPALARPYVVEMHPDAGLSSVAITGNNLSGCLEGINQAGLCVVELSDGQGDSGCNSPQAGLDESLTPRFLLDRCRTAAQAREALHEAKQYTRFSSCHFLVADADGDAFVWERQGDNVEHIIDADPPTFVVTNHLLAPNAAASDAAAGSVERRRSLVCQLDRNEFAGTDTHAALDEVRAETRATKAHGVPSAVTLWRTEYDMTTPSMTARFLLGLDQTSRYSQPVSIRLG